MQAKLLYFDTNDSIAGMKEDYNDYKLQGLQNRINICLLGLLLILTCAIGFGVKWNYHEPLYIGVVVFVVVTSAIMLALIVNCVGTDEFYSKYKSFESFATAECNLQYISLLDKDEPIFNELYRVGDHFMLRYSYLSNRGVVHNSGSDIRLTIKYNSNIEDIWCDVDKQVLYIPIKLKDRVLSRGYLGLDTFFTKNRLLRNA